MIGDRCASGTGDHQGARRGGGRRRRLSDQAVANRGPGRWQSAGAACARVRGPWFGPRLGRGSGRRRPCGGPTVEVVPNAGNTRGERHDVVKSTAVRRRPQDRRRGSAGCPRRPRRPFARRQAGPLERRRAALPFRPPAARRVVTTCADHADTVAERASAIGVTPDGRAATVPRAAASARCRTAGSGTTKVVAAMVAALGAVISADAGADRADGDAGPGEPGHLHRADRRLEKHHWMFQAENV